DVLIRGRVLKIGNATITQTKDISAAVTIKLVTGPLATDRTTPSTGAISVTHQLRFTQSGDHAWNIPQTVYVEAIDDPFVDGGDALVFPAFAERVNTIRGPLTIDGAAQVGGERFLNNPFRLPGETNDPLPDGRIEVVINPDAGDAGLTDTNAFHFNA